MFKNTIALIVFAFLVGTGCYYPNKKAISSYTEENDDSPSKIVVNTRTVQKQKTKTNIKKKKVLKVVQEQESVTELSAQKKIDNALELCNLAQSMWEKGKLDEALENLDAAYYSIVDIDSDISPDLNQQKEDIRFLISKRVLEIYASRRIVAHGSHNAIPLTLNKYVKKEIKSLTTTEKKFFVQSLRRAARYRPFIVKQLRKAGLPEEMSWLPLIESGFKIRALSRARALGLWQFIPSTGHKFGLTRNYYIDERLDPIKATNAAIAYLKELHNIFGDWTTALAAYNCGENRVLRVIRKQRINYLDDFWDLYLFLPRETARYVPRFLATLHIINNLEKYNIKVKSPFSPFKYKTFEVKKQLKLKDIAKQINVKSSLLKELNPELRYAVLPDELYPLKIPANRAELFKTKINKIKAAYHPVPIYVYHRVRKGETLSGIASRYRISVRKIMSVNKIRRANKIVAGKVLKVPSQSRKTADSNAVAFLSSQKKTFKHRVRQGDSLWNIARRFNTTTKNIMIENRLKSTTLYINQVLRITSGKKSISAKKKTYLYKVKSGDSPSLIAKKYRMRLNRFLKINNLNKRSKIFPGQRLIVE